MVAAASMISMLAEQAAAATGRFAPAADRRVQWPEVAGKVPLSMDGSSSSLISMRMAHLPRNVRELADSERRPYPFPPEDQRRFLRQGGHDQGKSSLGGDASGV